MKKLLFTTLFVLVFALGAMAQIPSPFSFYAGGALSLPNNPDGFKDTHKTGFHGMVGMGYKVGPGFQMVGKAEYHKFPFNFEGLDGVSGGSANMWLFGADGRFALGLPAAPVKPFVFAGAGLASVKQSDFTGNISLVSSLSVPLSEDQNKMYYNVGAGVEFKSGPGFSFFAQARYVNVATDVEHTVFIPITFGIKFF